MRKWPKAPLTFIGTFCIFAIWNTEDSVGTVCRWEAQSLFWVVVRSPSTSSMAGGAMLVGCFYIWMLASEASLAFHVMTVRSGFLETDACENRKVFLWKKSQRKQLRVWGCLCRAESLLASGTGKREMVTCTSLCTVRHAPLIFSQGLEKGSVCSLWVLCQRQSRTGLSKSQY